MNPGGEENIESWQEILPGRLNSKTQCRLSFFDPRQNTKDNGCTTDNAAAGLLEDPIQSPRCFPATDVPAVYLNSLLEKTRACPSPSESPPAIPLTITGPYATAEWYMLLGTSDQSLVGILY